MSKFQEIINGDTPVLVDFFAEWCGPCKSLAPILKDLAQEKGDSLKVIKIDVDKNRSAASAYQIQGVPTMILFLKGKILWRASGVYPKHELKRIIDEKLAS